MICNYHNLFAKHLLLLGLFASSQLLGLAQNSPLITQDEIEVARLYERYHEKCENSQSGKCVKMLNKLTDQALSTRYPDPRLYIYLKNKQYEAGDKEQGYALLQAGTQYFPGDKGFLVEIVNYYILADSMDAALAQLDYLLQEEPENISYLFAEASLYDMMGEWGRAKAIYNKIIILEPEYFNAWFNLGVYYYNEAVQAYQIAMDTHDYEEYQVRNEEGKTKLKEALRYVERAHEIDPNDYATMETLKTIYYRLKMDKEYLDVKAKLSVSQSPY